MARRVPRERRIGERGGRPATRQSSAPDATSGACCPTRSSTPTPSGATPTRRRSATTRARRRRTTTSSSSRPTARPRVVATRRLVEPGAGGPDDAPPLPDAYGGLAVAQGAPRTLLRVGGHGGHDVAARLDAAAQVLVWLAPVARGALAVDAVELDARRPRERPSSTHSAHSRGIDSSSICFTVDGRVGRVDGLDFEEVFCYVSDEDSSMEGLALYEYGIEMYWVDRKRDALCGAELECNDYWAVSEGFDEPIDVAVDERAAALYVADHTGIYKMDQVGSDLVLSAADAGLWTST